MGERKPVPDSLSTYDFVRQTGRDRYFEARDQEIVMLQDTAGRIKAEFAEPVKECPVCKNRVFERFFEKQGFQILRCTDIERCRHVFADPQINEEVLMKSYAGHTGTNKEDRPSANDLWIDVLLSETNQCYDSAKYKGGLEAIESVLQTGGKGQRRILDIGCSVGHFLDVARKQGWETLGLELNKKAISYARDVLKLDVRTQLLEEADLQNASFDAVTLWGVIEHLKRPIETLKEAVRVLKPGGVLLTFCPNAASLVCRVLREKAATFDGRNHPSYFTPTSIRLAMELAGLGNISITYYQADLDAVFNYIEGQDPYLKKSDRPSALKEFFQGQRREQAEKFILDNALGYKMMTINRKI